MSKAGRNDPCPCGSGQKYKKCCEMKKGIKRFNVQAITGMASQPGKLTSFFQNRVITPVHTPKPIKPSQEQAISE